MRSPKPENIMRSIIAVIIVIFALLYFWKITFITEGEYLSQYTGEILGFTMGTAVSTVLGFYFNGINNVGRRRKQDFDQPNGNGNGYETIQKTGNTAGSKQLPVQENS